MKSLIETLQAQKTDKNPERDVWVKCAKELVNRIRGWLSKAEEQKLLSIEEEQLEYSQPGLGTYQLPGLTLATDNRRVWLRPIGVDETDWGKALRVEVWSADEGFTLLRFADDDEWLVYEEGRKKADWPELDEGQFEGMMIQLVKA